MNKYFLMVGSLVLTLVVNALANIIPFNQQLTAQVSDKYFTYFTPENYVFGIWGLIYLSLAIFVLVLGLNSKKYKKYIDKVGNWFVLANIINAIWMLAWHYEQLGLSIILMVSLLLTLIQIYFISKDSKVTGLMRFPISLYLGWISVATVANISSYLVSIGFTNYLFPEQVYSSIMIVIALLLGLTMIKFEKDVVYFGVIVWAVYGIAVNFSSISEIYYTAIFSLAVGVIAAIYLMRGNLEKLLK